MARVRVPRELHLFERDKLRRINVDDEVLPGALRESRITWTGQHADNTPVNWRIRNKIESVTTSLLSCLRELPGLVAIDRADGRNEFAE
jgi:hypothetical protein